MASLRSATPRINFRTFRFLIEKTNLPSARWWRLIPVVFITYSLAYLDRANFGFGMAGGMQKDLAITRDQSSLLGALFFLGYFFFQVPGVYAAIRSARQLIFWSLIFWGALAAATGIVTDIHWLMFVRFLLGVIEGAVFPSMLVLLSRWFVRSERSRANSLLIFGNPITIIWMSIVSGYILNSLRWRWMFIIEGVPAIAWAFCWLYLVEDQPGKAIWMPPHESAALQAAIREEQQAIPPVRNFFAACRSPAVWMLCLIYAFWSLAVYGFVLWLPTILRAAGINIIRIGWLSAIPYFLAIIAMMAASWFSDTSGNRKLAIWPFLLLGAVSFYFCWLYSPGDFWLTFTLLCLAGLSLYAPYGPFFALITEILPANVAGGAIALINSCGALGAFVGTYFVGDLSGPGNQFRNAYIFLSISLLPAALLALTLPSKPRRRQPPPTTIPPPAKESFNV
jgi:sugar phosphate permease